MKWTTLLLIFCCLHARAQSISVQLLFDGHALERDSVYYPINDSISVNIEHLSFYISDFCSSAKAAQKSRSYHLISLDKPASCTIPIKKGKKTESNDRTVFFRVGVDSSTSVSGAYGGDLDPSLGMYWTWNSGYINFKLDGKDQHGKEYRLHLGGYAYPFASSMIVASQLHNQVLNVDVANFLRAVFRDQLTVVDLPGKNALRCSSYFGLLFP